MLPLSGLDLDMTVYFGLYLNGTVRRFKLDLDLKLETSFSYKLRAIRPKNTVNNM